MHTISLHNQLHYLHEQAEAKIAQKYPHAWEHLQHAEIPMEHFVQSTAQVATMGALSVSLLAGNMTLPIGENQSVLIDKEPEVVNETIDPADSSLRAPTAILRRLLATELPGKPHKLSDEASERVSHVIEVVTGITAVSKLDDKSLNTDYGLMGAEQHLPRFPGDTINQHDAYRERGITIGRGAFGYFVPDKSQLSDEAIQQEKYYVAVQTFAAPEWNTNSHEYKEWIKFRKVLLVNPQNGNTIVAVVGDAGPAKWTGKQFGGSPEVIHYLNEGKHSATTPVVLLFVDDPENKVPLGPVR